MVQLLLKLLVEGGHVLVDALGLVAEIFNRVIWNNTLTQGSRDGAIRLHGCVEEEDGGVLHHACPAVFGLGGDFGGGELGQNLPH